MSIPSTTYSRSTALVAGALILVTAAVFAQSLGYGFFAVDDSQYVVRNPLTQQGLTFDNLIAAFTEVQASNYHPITMVSLMLDSTVFGPEAGVFHRTNLIIHSVNTVLLFWLLSTMTGAPWPAAAVALLFAVHPLHVEPVVWISSRKDLLSTFFMFVAIAFYVRFVRSRSGHAYALMCVAFVLALLSKQMPVTLPFVLLLLDYWPLNRFAGYRINRSTLGALAIEKIPLFVLSVVFSVIILYVQQSTGALRSVESVPIDSRLINTPLAYVMYLVQTLVPAGLQGVGYSIPKDTPAWVGLACLALLIAITGVCLRYTRSAPYLPVGWFFFLGTLVPVIGLVPLGTTYRADRYTYLPLIGLFIIAAWGVAAALAHPKAAERRSWVVAAIALALLGYTVSAWAQVALWRDSKVVLTRVVEQDPEHYLANLTLGDLYRADNDRRKAAEYYLDTLRIAPGSARVHLRLGRMQAELGNHARAEPFFEAAYELEPDDLSGILGLARTKAGLRKYDQAEQILMDAIASGHPESAALQAELDRIRNRNQ